MTFVKCHHHSVCPAFFCIFYFIPSVMGSHKNNLYYQWQSDRESPPHYHPRLRGWLREGARRQSWARGVLQAQSANGCMWMSCSLFHTVASLSTLPCHSSLYLPSNVGEENEIHKGYRWISLSLFLLKRPKSLLKLLRRALESHFIMSCYPPESF